MFRRFGFVSALLLTLVSVAPAAAAPCLPGPDAAPAVSAAAVQTGDCAADGCQDCGLACSHGCCHAPHVGVMADEARPAPSSRFKSPASWADVLGAPLGAPTGPERPPRA